MAASLFLIAGCFKMACHRTNGITQPTYLNLLFLRTMLTALIQPPNGYCWQWTNKATTMKPVLLRSARMDIYILRQGTASATRPARQVMLRRTHSLCSEASCALM